VLRIIDRLNIGGPAKHVTWVTAGLDPRRYETMLVTGRVPAGEGDMTYFAGAAGIEPIVLDEMSRELSLADAVAVFRLLQLMRRFRPHIVHTHKSKAGAVGRVAALLYRWTTPSALLGKPRRCSVVHTFHGHTFHGYFGPTMERVFLALERLLARFATDRIVVISEQQRQEISGRFGVGRREQFRVVPLGIDLDEVSLEPSGLRAELGFRPDDVLVGIVGRLCAIKNHALFFQAVQQLVAERGDALPPVHFLVIGDGELRGDLENEARRLGIADRVVFMGFRRDAARLYPDLDVVALTSRNEGTPVTLIEALCAGRAVVSTEIGGVVDLLGRRGAIEQGVARWDHGLTVASGDAGAFARALRLLIVDPARRAGMGVRGRAFVRERLSKERLLRDLAGLYDELVAGALNSSAHLAVDSRAPSRSTETYPRL
jgi:glycosyltransferase involved in cell wall biosynthesis